jgi:hypothetical protein
MDLRTTLKWRKEIQRIFRSNKALLSTSLPEGNLFGLAELLSVPPSTLQSIIDQINALEGYVQYLDSQIGSTEKLEFLMELTKALYPSIRSRYPGSLRFQTDEEVIHDTMLDVLEDWYGAEIDLLGHLIAQIQYTLKEMFVTCGHMLRKTSVVVGLENNKLVRRRKWAADFTLDTVPENELVVSAGTDVDESMLERIVQGLSPEQQDLFRACAFVACDLGVEPGSEQYYEDVLFLVRGCGHRSPRSLRGAKNRISRLRSKLRNLAA